MPGRIAEPPFGRGRFAKLSQSLQSPAHVILAARRSPFAAQAIIFTSSQQASMRDSSSAQKQAGGEGSFGKFGKLGLREPKRPRQIAKSVNP